MPNIRHTNTVQIEFSPGWLVLYDAPGPDRRDGQHTVFGNLLRHNQ
ncbi:hypothetical protein [Rhodoferax sp.]|nr:hypothetical protein [Rhodoferax sp.]